MSTPTNLNTLSTVQYKFDIARLPNTTFFMQTAMIPGVDIDQPMHDQPRRNNQFTGSKITFDPMIVTFLIDEDMTNYLEIYRWIMEIMRTDDERRNKTDATLHILSGQMNAKMIARFVGIFPTSLSELSFGTNDDDNVIVTATATFNYAYFDFPQQSTIMGTDDLTQLNINGNTITFDI